MGDVSAFRVRVLTERGVDPDVPPLRRVRGGDLLAGRLRGEEDQFTAVATPASDSKWLCWL